MKVKLTSVKKKKPAQKHIAKTLAKAVVGKKRAPKYDPIKQVAIQRNSLRHDAINKASLEQEVIEAITDKKESIFPLLALPAELRNKIYELVVASPLPKRIDWNMQFKNPKYYIYGLPAQPALSKVSKQLRMETLPIFYGLNKFELWTRAPLMCNTPFERNKPFEQMIKVWLNCIGPLNCSLFRAFVLYVEAGKPLSGTSLNCGEKRYGMLLRKGARAGMGSVLAMFGIDFRIELHWQNFPNPDDDQAFQSALAADLGEQFEKNYFLRKRND